MRTRYSPKLPNLTSKTYISTDSKPLRPGLTKVLLQLSWYQLQLNLSPFQAHLLKYDCP